MTKVGAGGLKGELDVKKIFEFRTRDHYKNLPLAEKNIREIPVRSPFNPCDLDAVL